MATVTGISGSRYYVNNPIWVKVDRTGDVDPNAPVILTIVSNAQTVYNAKLYVYNSVVWFDLAEIMKGLIPEPSHPTTISSGQYIALSTLTVTIYLPNFTQTKTFFRGGEDSDRTNIQAPNQAILSESAKFPIWQGYPSAKYYLDAMGLPIYTEIIPNSEIERRQVVTCNPIFLRFLNSKGGYSFWLFDEWTITKNAKTTNVVERRDSDVDLGLTTTHQLALSTRAEERYTATLRALLQSPEVYIYRLDKVLIESNPQFVQTFTWTRIFNDGGSMKWNNFDSVNEFDFKFSLRLKTDPTLIW